MKYAVTISVRELPETEEAAQNMQAIGMYEGQNSLNLNQMVETESAAEAVAQVVEKLNKLNA